MKESVYIQQLFQNYLNDKISPEELNHLYEYFEIEENNELLEQLVRQQMQSAETDNEEPSDMQQVDRIISERWDVIAGLTSANRKDKKIRIYWITAAALLIGIGLCAMYFLITRQQSDIPAPSLTSIYGSDVAPGYSKATLTLSNGKQIQLDTAAREIRMGEESITYANGEIISSTEKIATATVNVPNGGIYSIILPDGSKIILNSGSSITYPIQFTDSIRMVELSGEAYFSVTSDKTKPFKVNSAGQIITVLGTRFNVQSYKGEQLCTTLLEGKVSLSSGSARAILKPGQQAIMQNNHYSIQDVPAEESIGWTKNLFSFSHLNLDQIGRQLERWYDISIIWPDDMTNERYLMVIPRDRNLSDVLSSIADLTGLKFKIEGRRVTATVK